MAKINLNQHNQENPNVIVTVASLGLLMCMVVTVLGIKLWWFKHRLSFEQTSTQNGAAGGNLPTVPKRNKKQRFNKDKRWSQQIYSNVEVHGVFRQKQEDDFDIQRPQQLPPVRIRQLSESTQSLILPPPRNKRRQQQVHSTAFEDLDTGTPIWPLSPTVSTTALATTDGSETRLSLTFGEFEKQFKLKEIKPEVCEAAKTNEVIEIPVPSLRLNRSSSAMVNPEKTPRYLKSSQSITMPEFHKVIERRPTGFSRPSEDLTKIDDYEEPKLFENFGERRPTGYIKYEEVDRNLNEQYEKDLNQEEGNVFESWEHTKDLQALEALRNERIIYQNDLNESPDVANMKESQFKADSYTRSFKQDSYINRDFRESFEEITLEKLQNLKTSFKEFTKSGQSAEISTEYEDFSNIPHDRTTGFVKNEEEQLTADRYEEIDYKSVKERRPTKFVKGVPQEISNEQYEEFDYKSVKEQDQPQNISNDFTKGLDEFDYKSVKERRPTEFVRDQPQDISNDIPDDFDNQFTNWPQFEEKIETPKVNIRKFENHEFQTQTSVEESEDVINIQAIKVQSITFDETDGDYIHHNTNENSSLKQRRPTGYIRNWVEEHYESPDLSEIENFENVNVQNSSYKQKKLYNQVRSLMTDDNNEHQEKREVTFEMSDIENSESEENSQIKQRRPTGFERKKSQEFIDQENREVKFEVSEIEYCKTDDHESSLIKQRRPTGFVRKETEVSIKRGFNYEFSEIEYSETDDHEYSAIKQRRPTGFVRNEKEQEENERSVTFNFSKDKDFERDNENSTLNQRRPTGYVRDFHKEIGDDEHEKHHVKFENSNWPDDNEHENYTLNQRRPTGFIRNPSASEYSDDDQEIVINELKETKVTFSENILDSQEDSEIWLGKQRRPTGFIRETQMEELLEKETSDLKVKFAESTDFKESESDFKDSQLKQRRPTGFPKNSYTDPLESTEISNDILKIENPTVRFKEFEQLESDLETHNDSLIKQRKTDIENINETSKQVNFKLNDSPDEEDKNSHENEALKNRRPTGYVKKMEIQNVDLPAHPLYHTPVSWQTNELKSNELVDPLWQELEKDLDHDFAQNVEEEFAKIRHSYEINEGDFLELKEELRREPASNKTKPLGFGKSIEDDWDNFEKLKTPPKVEKRIVHQPEIQITYNEQELITTSILKETKLNQETPQLLADKEDIQPKPRKSKVTFDFKTEEHLIPARNTELDSEEEDYYEDYSDYDNDDVYNKPPPSIPPPPKPMERLSSTKYNTDSSSSLYSPVVAIPTSISLFGSQISQEDDKAEDSWSAIRKHRNLTVEFQSLSLDSSMPPSSPPPVFINSPPKPAYRNPLAQLAIQRAKEVRTDMDGFKPRSIKKVKKPEASKRNPQNMLNLKNDEFDDTEA